MLCAKYLDAIVWVNYHIMTVLSYDETVHKTQDLPATSLRYLTNALYASFSNNNALLPSSENVGFKRVVSLFMVSDTFEGCSKNFSAGSALNN